MSFLYHFEKTNVDLNDAVFHLACEKRYFEIWILKIISDTCFILACCYQNSISFASNEDNCRPFNNYLEIIHLLIKVHRINNLNNYEYGLFNAYKYS